VNKFLELYQQASKHAYETIDPEFWKKPVFNEIVVGYFAELIVKECVDFAFAKGDNVDYLKEYFKVRD
jgi:hypothetical protein